MTTFPFAGRPILVTGAHGFLGSHVVDALRHQGVADADLRTPSSRDANLLRPKVCRAEVEGVDLVIHLAAKVGGIGLNKERPGELFYENALMGLLLMEEARRAGVKKFVSFGTTCSYPKHTPVPFSEDALWNGAPDEITGPYGLAKKMQLVQGQAYRDQYGFNAVHLIPTNLYGPRDHFDERFGHVIPSLIRRFLTAVETKAPVVTVWGTGKASREFLYVEDAARGVVMAAADFDSPEPVNLGSGVETPIRELVQLIAEQTGFAGRIEWDATKPDGQPRRSLNTSRALDAFGFTARVPLEEGLDRTIRWYRDNRAAGDDLS